MDSKKSNKIREIVRLQQILKKWKKLAATNPAAKTRTTSISTTNSNSSSSKSIKFLKKTLSFTESSAPAAMSSSSSSDVVPKGYLSVCVGKELKRFLIPMEYLGHQAFGILLREAEEEFGFQQQGVLKIPCEVPVFEKILKMMEEKREVFYFHDTDISTGFGGGTAGSYCYSPSPDCDQLPKTQLCRCSSISDHDLSVTSN